MASGIQLDTELGVEKTKFTIWSLHNATFRQYIY